MAQCWRTRPVTVGEVTGSPPPRAPAARVRAGLAAAAKCGPFFALEAGPPAHEADPPAYEAGRTAHEAGPPAHEAGRTALAPGWQPVADLYLDGLPALIASTARQLSTDDRRVAASILHLSLAARLWSPVLASGLLSAVVPDLSTLTVAIGPPLRLGVAQPAGWTVSDQRELARLSAEVVGAQLQQLADALPVRLAPGLLRGNAASAMAGALGVLAATRPDLSGTAAGLAQALLRTSCLRRSGVLGADAPLSFRRQSCCLYYRLPGGGLCGDCCFRRPPGRRDAG
jgi:hypothetical protein